MVTKQKSYHTHEHILHSYIQPQLEVKHASTFYRWTLMWKDIQLFDMLIN